MKMITLNKTGHVSVDMCVVRLSEHFVWHVLCPIFDSDNEARY